MYSHRCVCVNIRGKAHVIRRTRPLPLRLESKRLLTDRYMGKGSYREEYNKKMEFLYVQISLQSCVAALTSLRVDHICYDYFLTQGFQV